MLTECGRRGLGADTERVEVSVGGASIQVVAIILGVVALGFFAFATAYYVRNRRIALAARESQVKEAEAPPSPKG